MTRNTGMERSGALLATLRLVQKFIKADPICHAIVQTYPKTVTLGEAVDAVLSADAPVDWHLTANARLAEIGRLQGLLSIESKSKREAYKLLAIEANARQKAETELAVERERADEAERLMCQSAAMFEAERKAREAMTQSRDEWKCRYEQMDDARIEAQRELATANEQLERERMRLAACGVVAMADTPESAAQARNMHQDYWSASCADVARVVDKLMAERKVREEAERKLAVHPARIEVLEFEELKAEREALQAKVDAFLAAKSEP